MCSPWQRRPWPDWPGAGPLWSWPAGVQGGGSICTCLWSSGPLCNPYTPSLCYHWGRSLCCRQGGQTCSPSLHESSCHAGIHDTPENTQKYNAMLCILRDGKFFCLCKNKLFKAKVSLMKKPCNLKFSLIMFRMACYYWNKVVCSMYSVHNVHNFLYEWIYLMYIVQKAFYYYYYLSNR